MTGTGNLLSDLAPKFFELMSELLPQATTIGLLVNPTNPSAVRAMLSLQQLAAANTKQVAVAEASVPDELDALGA